MPHTHKVNIVNCTRIDCLFHQGDCTEEPGMELCSHNDKSHYPGPGTRCPLFRVDWQRAKRGANIETSAPVQDPKVFLKMMRGR